MTRGIGRAALPGPVSYVGLTPKWRSGSGVTFQDRLLLRRLADGQTVTQAAPGLGVTRSTASARATRLRRRLGLGPNHDLGQWARDNITAWEEPSRIHVREATTPTTLLGEGVPGLLLADCSCGDTYTVPEGALPTEFQALEAAHAAHVRKVEGKKP